MALAAGLAGLAQLAPSTLVLGALAPGGPARLPFGWCTWRGSPARKEVALTFDDGPSRATEQTLELLDRLGLRASFFVLGELAQRRRDLVSEMRAAGHAVGSHGHRHEHHLLRGPGWIRCDIARSVEVIEAAAARPRWFRPPYGQLTTATVIAARRQAMRVVLWSGWGREFADEDEERVLGRLVGRLRPGAILLLHDSDEHAPAGTAARTHRVLPRLAEAMDRAGLSAVTLDQLLSPPPSGGG